MEKMRKLIRELFENRSGGGSSNRYNRYNQGGGGGGGSNSYNRGGGGGGGSSNRGGGGSSNRYDGESYRETEREREEEERRRRYEEEYEDRGGRNSYNHFGSRKEKDRMKSGERERIGFKNYEEEEYEELEILEEFEERLIRTIEKLEKEEPELFNLVECKLHEMMNGPHFTKELCEKSLRAISKEYGRREPEFECEEAKQIAKKFGVEFREFNEHDWCYALNITHYLYEDICREDIQMCARLAYLWLCDKAIPEGKSFYHYLKHLKCKEEEE